jgi:hypothetical protein
VIWDSNPGGGKTFSLLQSVQTGSGTDRASYSMDTRASFTGCKVTGHEADHSPLSHDDVKNECSDTSTPPVCLHGVYRDSFTLLYYLLHEST